MTKYGATAMLEHSCFPGDSSDHWTTESCGGSVDYLSGMGKGLDLHLLGPLHKSKGKILLQYLSLLGCLVINNEELRVWWVRSSGKLSISSAHWYSS